MKIWKSTNLTSEKNNNLFNINNNNILDNIIETMPYGSKGIIASINDFRESIMIYQWYMNLHIKLNISPRL